MLNVIKDSNTFDEIIVLLSEAILDVNQDGELDNKDNARGFINRLRQKFIDWNYTEFHSDAFKKIENEIDALYEEKNGKIGFEAEALLKDGE